MNAIIVATTTANAIAYFENVYNERITIVSEAPAELLGGKSNPHLGKVMKRSKYDVWVGSSHSFAKKLEKAGKKLATSASIENDEDIEAINRKINALWKGRGEHVKGSIVRHTGTDERYIMCYLIPESKAKAVYTLDGVEILPENIQGFKQTERVGAEVALTNGDVVETKIMPTTVKIKNLKSYKIVGNPEINMIVENI